MLREAAMGQIQPFLSASAEPSIIVFNTLNWKRSGVHTLYIDNQILPKDRSFRILNDANCEIPAQIQQSRPEGNYWALLVNDVPPLSYGRYRIVVGSGERNPDRPCIPADTMESAFYRLVLDPKRGTITSLFDRELNQELLDPRSQWQLGELIYERLSDRRPMEALQLGKYTRTSMRDVRITAGIDGPIWQSLGITGISNGFTEEKGVSCEIRLFKTIKRIDLLFKGRKIAVNDPEAVYVAFPFVLHEGKLVFEAQGGVIEPGIQQLPGTANDWNTVQNFAALRGPAAQILLVSDEIPLMQFGGINTGRYRPEARPATQQIYSWVLNNYWTTNFRSSQEGEMSWSYVLTSGADPGNEHATRFGWGVRVPLVSRVLPGAAHLAKRASPQSFWPFKSSSILLVSAKPATSGMILHLREIGGTATTLTFAPDSPGWQFEEVDALGSPLKSVLPLAFKPFETKFIRLWR